VPLKSKVKQGKIQDRIKNDSTFMTAVSMWSWAAAAEEHQQLAQQL